MHEPWNLHLYPFICSLSLTNRTHVLNLCHYYWILGCLARGSQGFTCTNHRSTSRSACSLGRESLQLLVQALDVAILDGHGRCNDWYIYIYIYIYTVSQCKKTTLIRMLANPTFETEFTDHAKNWRRTATDHISNQSPSNVMKMILRKSPTRRHNPKINLQSGMCWNEYWCWLGLTTSNIYMTKIKILLQPPIAHRSSVLLRVHNQMRTKTTLNIRRRNSTWTFEAAQRQIRQSNVEHWLLPPTGRAITPCDNSQHPSRATILRTSLRRTRRTCRSRNRPHGAKRRASKTKLKWCCARTLTLHNDVEWTWETQPR